MSNGLMRSFFGKSNQQNNNGNSSGNGDGNNQNNGNDGGNGNNQNNGNNNQNPTDFTEGLWDAPVDKNTNNGGNQNNNNNNQNNNNQNNNQQPPNPITAFDDYVKGLDFGTKFKAEDVEKLKNGDTSVLPGMFEEIQRSTYKAAMMDVNRLVEAKVGAAVKEAVSQANGARNIDGLVSRMNGELEFTKDPLIAPVAKTILGRALTKGLSSDDAITAVTQYFKKVANSAGDLLDDGKGRMAGKGRYGNQSEDNTDFVALLSGQD